MAETYAELLRRPEWHIRREQIFRLAGYKCEDCGRCREGCERCEYHDDFADRLECHHRYYQRGKKPWEYPDVALLCLCRQCHEERTLRFDVLSVAIGLMTQVEQESFLSLAKETLANRPQYSHIFGDRDPHDLIGNFNHLPMELGERLRWLVV